VVRSDRASVIAWASRWVSLGSSWEVIGKMLGRRSASPWRTQGGRRGNAGEKLSAWSLDVGVSRKWGGARC
jgi:hypothetical protein